jgi:hypothetical protein
MPSVFPKRQMNPRPPVSSPTASMSSDDAEESRIAEALRAPAPI